MGSVHLYTCCPSQFFLEITIVREDARERLSEEVESKWLKGGSLT